MATATMTTRIGAVVSDNPAVFAVGDPSLSMKPPSRTTFVAPHAGVTSIVKNPRHRERFAMRLRATQRTRTGIAMGANFRPNGANFRANVHGRTSCGPRGYVTITLEREDERLQLDDN